MDSFLISTLVSSSLIRKLTFAGLMYTAGGTIISTVGLLPTLVVGSIILLT